MTLTKFQAIAMFGSGAALGRALGITKSAVSQWPEVLDQRTSDEIIGAALRLGKQIPVGLLVRVEVA